MSVPTIFAIVTKAINLIVSGERMLVQNECRVLLAVAVSLRDSDVMRLLSLADDSLSYG